MMDLFIGLCFGAASAIALAIMWRMAGQLRKELQSRDNPTGEKKVARPGEVAKDSSGDG